MSAAAYSTRVVREGVRGKNPLFFPRRLSTAFDARKRPPKLQINTAYHSSIRNRNPTAGLFSPKSRPA